MSETPHVYTAINAVASELAKKGIAKGERNKNQGYNFRGIDAVHCVLGPILATHGLVIVPEVTNRQETVRQTAKGGTLYSVSVDVQYTFYSINDGSLCVGSFVGEGMDSGDKATNKAMSAAYKYMAIQTFCIPTHGNDDADYTTHEASAPKPQQARNEWLPRADAAIAAHPAETMTPENIEMVQAMYDDGAFEDVCRFFETLDNGENQCLTLTS